MQFLSTSCFRVFVLAFLVCLCTSPAIAQEGQDAEIEERLDEVQNMIEEERSTIATLESQLKSALDRGESEQVTRLRNEINGAYDSLEQLEELNKQLQDLRDAARKDDPPTRMRLGKRKRVPNPKIGGFEAGPLPDERANREREADKERPRRADAGDPEVGIAGGGAGMGRDRNRTDSSRLRHLRDAMRALVMAGEDRLADSVENLIAAEERRLDRERTARSRGRNRDQTRDGGNRPGVAGGGANRGGGFMVDGPSDRGATPQARGNSRPDQPRNRTRASRDEMDDLQEEIDRLNQKLRELRERGSGGR